MKLAKSTIKNGLSFGGETLKELKDVSKKKSLYGDYLTSAFLDLIFYPTISILQKTIKQNNDQLALIKTDSKNSNIALITMTVFFPSFILILIFLLLTYIRKFRGMKNNLGELDVKVESFLVEKDTTQVNF